MKITIILNSSGKLIIKDLPPELSPGEYDVEYDLLYSVGLNEPKRVSLLNKTLFDRAKNILEENTQNNTFGLSGLGMFIDYLEEHYDISKREVKS